MKITSEAIVKACLQVTGELGVKDAVAKNWLGVVWILGKRELQDGSEVSSGLVKVAIAKDGSVGFTHQQRGFILGSDGKKVYASIISSKVERLLQEEYDFTSRRVLAEV